jgi:hypothetical protein
MRGRFRDPAKLSAMRESIRQEGRREDCCIHNPNTCAAVIGHEHVASCARSVDRTGWGATNNQYLLNRLLLKT